MIKTIIAALSVLCLPGCLSLSSAPRENVGFAPASDAGVFRGIYRNQGDPPSLYLSQLIWTERKPTPSTEPLVRDAQGNLARETCITTDPGRKICDRDIDSIEVLSVDAALTVNAIKDGCVASTRTYLVGRDFTLTDGRIVLRNDMHLLSRGPGDVMLGPSYEKVELGLYTKGDGKYKNETYFAGMVFMLIPMAGGGAEEVRFERINPVGKQFEKCK